jgi:hypothetical protein
MLGFSAISESPVSGGSPAAGPPPAGGDGDLIFWQYLLCSVLLALRVD